MKLYFLNATQRRPRPRLCAALAAALLLLPIGCASPPPELIEPTERPAAIDHLSAADLLPEDAKTGEFTALDKEQQPTGDPLPFRLERGDGEKTWVLEIEGRSRATWHQRDDGGIALVEEIDYREEVRVTYEPGIVILPGTLASRSEAQSVKMTVHDLESDDIREQGTCKVTLPNITAAEADPSAAGDEGVRVQQRREIDLSAADVDVRIQTTWAPGLGPVRYTIWRKTRAIGLIETVRLERLVRLNGEQ